jgi:hypothetical protein
MMKPYPAGWQLRCAFLACRQATPLSRYQQPYLALTLQALEGANYLLGAGGNAHIAGENEQELVGGDPSAFSEICRSETQTVDLQVAPVRHDVHLFRVKSSIRLVIPRKAPGWKDDRVCSLRDPAVKVP